MWLFVILVCNSKRCQLQEVREFLWDVLTSMKLRNGLGDLGDFGTVHHGDGTISMADGVGIKAVDSNELRRKIRGPTPTHQNLSKSNSISLGSAAVGVPVAPPQIPSMIFDSKPNYSSEFPSIPQTSEHSQSLQSHAIPSELQALKMNVSGDLKNGSTNTRHYFVRISSWVWGVQS